jgi:hypothetical protein
MANELYVPVDYVAAQLGQTDASRHGLIAGAVEAACRRIDGHCNRTFSKTTADTSRVFRALTPYQVEIDDCYSITTVKTDTGDDAAFATTWPTTDYVTEPLNGYRHGHAWPTTKLVAVEASIFPASRRPTVQVTGKWGWTRVPEPVISAALQLSIMFYRSPDAPFGTAGIADLGLTRVRMPKVVEEILSDFVVAGTGAPMVA